MASFGAFLLLLLLLLGPRHIQPSTYTNVTAPGEAIRW